MTSAVTCRATLPEIAWHTGQCLPASSTSLRTSASRAGEAITACSEASERPAFLHAAMNASSSPGETLKNSIS